MAPGISLSALAFGIILVLPLGLGVAGASSPLVPASISPPSPPVPHYRPVGSEYQGRYVSFDYDAASGEVKNVALSKLGEGSIVLFSDLRLPGATPLASPTVEGSIFQVNFSKGSLAIHDNPTAGIRATLNTSGSVEFVLGALDAKDDTQMPGGRFLLLEEGGRAMGVLFTDNGTITVDGKTVTVTLEVRGNVLVRMAPLNSGALELGLLLGLARGRVGAEVTLELKGNALDADSVTYRPHLNVNPSGSVKNRVVLALEDQDATGTVVLLRVQRSLLTPPTARGLTVDLDGARVAGAASVEDILAAVVGGVTASSHLVLEDPTFFQVLVYIPHFSSHELVIGAIPPGTLVVDNAALAALGAGTLVAVLAGVGLFRRRR